MELRDFRPAILYNLLMALDTNIFDVETGIATSLGYQNGIEEVAEYSKNNMRLVAECLNEYLLEDEKIDYKYLYEEDAPEGYFENLGKKLLKKHFDSLYSIASEVVKAMAKYHDTKVSTNVPNYKLLVMTKSDKCVESLPFYYGGAYLVKKYGLEFYSILLHMGINLIDIDDDYVPILHDKFIEAINDACGYYIEDNMIYRFTHMKNEIKSLPMTYEPLFPRSIPEKYKEKAEKRNEIIADEYFAKEIVKVIVRLNTVFNENIWIPDGEEDE